jgi:hypothetical protein
MNYHSPFNFGMGRLWRSYGINRHYKEKQWFIVIANAVCITFRKKIV